MKKICFLMVALLLAEVAAVSTSGTYGAEEAGLTLEGSDGMSDILENTQGKK